MATTALTIDGRNLLFMTVLREDNMVDVDIFMANESFMPIGTPSIGFCDKTEEEYHCELRQAAHENNQLIADYCTNPEWNPKLE